MAFSFNPSDYRGDIFQVIQYSAFGKAQNDAVYGGTFNIRKSADYSLKFSGHAEVTEKQLLDRYDANLALELYCSKIKSLYDIYLLFAMGPINVYLETAKGEWINHVDNGVFGNGKPSLPASGSWLLGGLLTFEASDKDRMIKAKLNGMGYRNEMVWMENNSAAVGAGGSSGNTISGLTTMGYDLTQYGTCGIVDVTVDGQTLGPLAEGCKYSLDFKEPSNGKIQSRGWPIMADAVTDATMPMFQVAIPTEILQSEAWALADHTVNFVFADGLTISYVNSIIPTLNYVAKEGNMFVNEIGFKSKIPIDRPAWGATNLNFNVAANTLTISSAGYQPI